MRIKKPFYTLFDQKQSTSQDIVFTEEIVDTGKSNFIEVTLKVVANDLIPLKEQIIQPIQEVYMLIDKNELLYDAVFKTNLGLKFKGIYTEEGKDYIVYKAPAKEYLEFTLVPR